MFYLLILWIIIKESRGEWLQVYQGFIDLSTTTYIGWTQVSKYNYPYQYQSFVQTEYCYSSGLNFVQLSYNYYELYRTFYFKHKIYQTQIIVDVIYDNYQYSISSSKYFEIFQSSSSVGSQILLSRYYTSQDLNQKSNRVCNSNSQYSFKYTTFVSTTITINAGDLSLYFYFLATSAYYDYVKLRNLFIQIQYCAPKCDKCTGPDENQCSTCQYGTLQISGSCTCNYQHQFAMTGVGCLQECPRNYYITNQNQICVPDRRIYSFRDYFASSSSTTVLSPFEFLPDPQLYRQKYFTELDCQYSYYIVGFFQYNEGVVIQIDEVKALAFIRLRITFSFFNIQTDSSINLFLDDDLRAKILKTSSSYQFMNFINIVTKGTVSCMSVRVETILQTSNLSPRLTIKGIFKSNIESWGFFNMTIDAGLCQEFCDICSDFNTCSSCITGYVLYQNRCVVTCPIYSQDCIDYSDEYPYSEYLAKGFYDFNMTLDQINSFYDSVTNSGTNFITDQMFSFFPNKIMLGGLLVWYDASYIKTYTIQKPHYAISIRFNLTFGDEYPGEFYYYLDSAVNGPYTLPSTGQNLVGKNNQERPQYFYNFYAHTSSTFNFELKCVAPASFDIRDGFCAISEYFMVVHNCQPFCIDCNDATSCNTWQSGYSGQSVSSDNSYFDTTLQMYIMYTCSSIGCLSCNKDNFCTDCSTIDQFDLQNGICYCNKYTYLAGTTCASCNSYCEYCIGPSSRDCISCNSDFLRSLQDDQCKCIPGYQDDGFNLLCIPFCGDKMIVKGEDCDDGNNNPHDGCDQCKFSCTRECDLCVLGICESCILGYYLIQNNCFPICHNYLSPSEELCTAITLTTNEECVECQYLKCSKYCTICQMGVCLKCQENNGWYLQEDNTCQPICGDLIIAKPYEACDDGNNDAFDGCNQCLMTCGKYCDKCLRGQCTTCLKGFQLNTKKQCISNCGDKLGTMQEECDDGNNIKYDGCYKCQVSCQPACTKCTSKGCSECNTTGWEFNKIEKKCETVCGDGIIIYGQEECDDAISENCYHCKFRCQESCTLCQFGKCKKCNTGWILNKIDQYCYTIPGDSLILGSEQCDDFNLIDNDRCTASVLSCQLNCDSCLVGRCQKCKEGYFVSNGLCYEIANDGLIVGQEQCDDANQIPYDGCYQSKFDCPQYCKNCVRGICLVCNQKIGYGYLDIQNNRCLASPLDMNSNEIIIFQCDQECSLCKFGKCLECQYGYYLNVKINKCVSFCGDLIVSGNEQCDDGNDNLSDGCVNCRLICDEHCSSCVNGQCNKCHGYGYSLNPTNKRCETVCGDKMVAGLEICDDGNDLPEDGCFLCSFECQKSCTFCFFGVCLKCLFGWKIGKSELDCVPICGDNLIIKGHEECDDGNMVPYDGCFDCKYQCQEQCTDCQKGVCFACDVQGWDIYNNLCYAVCGDGYLVEGPEQCDDGNKDKYDGCYECQYQCEQLCTMCDKGICKECNHLGWIIKNNVCTPYCGDGLVVGNEQCDDMNELDNDGCYECQFQCDEFCIDCLDGICVECQEYRYVKRNVCLAECGDGKFVQQAEQCDDGNDNNNDGCNYKCQVEDDWLCYNSQGTSSNCFYTQKPQMKLSFLHNDPKNIQYAQLSFNQPLKRSPDIQGEITKFIIPTIPNLEPKQYHINQELNQQISSYDVSEIIIKFEISFYSPVKLPILEVEILNDPFLSDYNLTLKVNKKTLSLPTPSILSETQKKIALSAQAFNKGVIYSLAGVSSLCIMTGSTDLFWNLMDQLQYLSYIKYINIQFPNNLEIYYDTFKLITISPVITALKIDYLFAMIDGEDEYQIITTGKFFNDEINAYFLINFQSFLFLMISGFSMYVVTKYTYIFLMLHRSRITWNLKFQNFMKRISRMLLKQYKSFFYSGILRIIMSNWYDVSFATAIQLAYYQGDRFAQVINYIVSLIIYIGQFLVTLFLIGIVDRFAKKSSICMKYQYESLFEDVKRSPNFWTLLYNPLLLFKKQVFISLLVFMQQQGQIQALSIAVFQTCFLAYLLINRPLRNKFQLRKLICTESLIIFNSISFLLYAYQKELALTVDICINFGWFHIFTSTMILGVSLFFDLVRQSKIMISKLRLYKIKKMTEQELQNRLAIFF